MVVLRLLGRQALMGCVAAVGKPRPLLKCLHAVVSLLWDTKMEDIRAVLPPGGRLPRCS